jgi:hypothetical protein
MGLFYLVTYPVFYSENYYPYNHIPAYALALFCAGI